MDNWNKLEIGVVYIVFGVLFAFYCSQIHKKYKNKGYKLFQGFRRPEKSQSEDNIFIMMYARSLFGIYAGYGFIAVGILFVTDHLFNLNIFHESTYA